MTQEGVYLTYSRTAFLARNMTRITLSCSPAGVDAQTQLETQNDPFFQGAVKQWETVTKSRYLEGDCVDAEISGYQGFPVKKCSYQNAGEGDKNRPLSAKAGGMRCLGDMPGREAIVGRAYGGGPEPVLETISKLEHPRMP
jgi:hypothetical protein